MSSSVIRLIFLPDISFLPFMKMLMMEMEYLHSADVFNELLNELFV